MNHPGNEWCADGDHTPSLAAHAAARANTAALLRHADTYAASRQEVLIRRDAAEQAHRRLQNELNDALVELDDAGQALAEAHAEQALGLPCLSVGALDARMERSIALRDELRAQLSALEMLSAGLNGQLHNLDRTLADAYRRAG